MSPSPLLEDLRRLRHWPSHETSSEQSKQHQHSILELIKSVGLSYELRDILLERNGLPLRPLFVIVGLQLLIDSDIGEAGVIWKHPYIEEFIERAWRGEKFSVKQTYGHPNRWHRYWHSFTTLALQPRYSPPPLHYNRSLLWISHILYNLLYFVLLTIFLYQKTLLIYFPHPFEIPIIILFIIPSLFPPYTPLFPGYLTIDIIFLVAFIFRGIAFSYWPYPTIEVVNLLLNSRTLLSFLPFIQIINSTLLIFRFPRLQLIFRIVWPVLPILILGFMGSFLTLYFLADTHIPARNVFDILLKTVLLDIHPGKIAQFHPVAGRITYYLFSFFILYGFWGVGIAGIGMRIVRETDWHVERVRCKAIRLLRYIQTEKRVKRKRLLGRGKVVSGMPFNVIEWVGVVLRLEQVRWFSVYASMVLVVLGWSLALGCIRLGKKIRDWLQRVGGKIVDEFDEDSEGDGENEDGVNETTRLLS